MLPPEEPSSTRVGPQFQAQIPQIFQKVSRPAKRPGSPIEPIPEERKK